MIKEILNIKILAVLVVMLVSILVAASAIALDATRPTIIEVTPTNNQLSIGTHDAVIVKFSEQMDPKTINQNTFIVVQRTTEDPKSPDFESRQVKGTIIYEGLTATFTPNAGPSYNPLQPSQKYGNIFTATITTGAKDLDGNSLSENYMWSFSTGGASFIREESTSQPEKYVVPVSTPAKTTSTPATTKTSATVPITGAVTQVKTSSFPWNWIIVGLAIVALIALVTTIVTNQKSRKIFQVSKLNPFGDIHPVQDIEGIGLEYNKALLAMGIADTKQLWNANAAKVAKTTGAPLVSVKSWQNMAELATIHDIGPQYAELLERSGIHNISQLRTCNPNQLLKLVREKQKSINMSIQGNTPGHALVENWISQAHSHVYASEGLTA